MATASPGVLPSVNINTAFSVTVTVLPDQGEEGPIETINSVTAVLVGLPLEPEILIQGGSNTVTISGKHANTFTDQFTYVNAGESDKTQTPIQVIGIGSVPPNENLYRLEQDQRNSALRVFNLIVNQSKIIPINQTVLNPLEVMRQFMANYNYNRSKE